MIRIWAVTNWKTTRPLLSKRTDVPGVVILLLRAVMGLNPERIRAGYKPAKRLTPIQSAVRRERLWAFSQLRGIFLSSRVLRSGIKRRTDNAAARMTRAVIRKVSAKNCLIS